jgi:hypothetical protein
MTERRPSIRLPWGSITVTPTPAQRSATIMFRRSVVLPTPLLPSVEPKAGRHFTYATPDRSAVEFAQVAFDLATQYPKAETIHLVMDNLNIHRRKSLMLRTVDRDSHEVVYSTPVTTIRNADVPVTKERVLACPGPLAVWSGTGRRSTWN